MIMFLFVLLSFLRLFVCLTYLFQVYFNGPGQTGSPLHDRIFQTLPTIIRTVYFFRFSFNGVTLIKSSSVFLCLHVGYLSFTAPGHLKIVGISCENANTLFRFSPFRRDKEGEWQRLAGKINQFWQYDTFGG